MIATFFTAVMAFIATNTDDLFINMLLFSAATDKKQTTAIVQGKFLGTALLLTISGSAAFGLQAVAGNRLWLLGFVPIALGLKALWNNIKGNNEDGAESITPSGAVNTALITLASGADNIGVYVPLFASVQAVQMAVCTAVFFALTGLWCIVADRLTQFSTLQSAIEKYRKIIVPAVYICLGMYIIMSK